MGSERLAARYAPAVTNLARGNIVSKARVSAYLLRYDTTLTEAERWTCLDYYCRWLYGIHADSVAAESSHPFDVLSQIAITLIQNMGGDGTAQLPRYALCNDCGLISYNTGGHCNGCDPAAFCENCYGLADECGCMSCDDCGRRGPRDYYCGDCGRGACCGCTCTGEDDEEEREMSDNIKSDGRIWPAKHPVDRTLWEGRLGASRLAGVEIEYGECADFTAIKRFAKEWHAEVHRDGSCGWELVTSPAAGNHLVRQVKDAARALETAKATCTSSCGLHVHVDARDISWHDMQRLLTVWLHIEPAMFVLAGQSRYTNQYSNPWGKNLQFDTKDALAASLWPGYLQPRRIRTSKGGIIEIKPGGMQKGRPFTSAEVIRRGYMRSPEKKGHNGERYHSLNICPWMARLPTAENYNNTLGRYVDSTRISTKIEGKSKFRDLPNIRKDSTVEFRLHEGTHDAAELLEWTKLCVRIVDYAATATDAMVAELPADGMRAITLIAPASANYVLSKVKAWRTAFKLRQRKISYRPDANCPITWRLETPKFGWAIVKEVKAPKASPKALSGETFDWARHLHAPNLAPFNPGTLEFADDIPVTMRQHIAAHPGEWRPHRQAPGHYVNISPSINNRLGTLEAAQRGAIEQDANYEAGLARLTEAPAPAPELVFADHIPEALRQAIRDNPEQWEVCNDIRDCENRAVTPEGNWRHRDSHHWTCPGSCCRNDYAHLFGPGMERTN